MPAAPFIIRDAPVVVKHARIIPVSVCSRDFPCWPSASRL